MAKTFKKNTQAQVETEVKDDLRREIIEQNTRIRQMELKYEESNSQTIALRNAIKKEHKALSQMIDELEGELPLLDSSDNDDDEESGE